MEVRPMKIICGEQESLLISLLAGKFWGFYDETANERYKAQFGGILLIIP
jgi:hypothetical protein